MFMYIYICMYIYIYIDLAYLHIIHYAVDLIFCLDREPARAPSASTAARATTNAIRSPPENRSTPCQR